MTLRFRPDDGISTGPDVPYDGPTLLGHPRTEETLADMTADNRIAALGILDPTHVRRMVARLQAEEPENVGPYLRYVEMMRNVHGVAIGH